jgi:outer membrane PBP1 activator LpoA protein
MRITARITAIALIAALLGACQTGSSMMQTETLNRAEQMERSGQYAGAGAIYEDLAADSRGADRDRYNLLAARAWVKAGQPSRARTRLAEVDGPMEADDLYLWSLVSAGLALDQDQPKEALRLLDEAPRTGPPRFAIDAYLVRADANFRLGNSVAAVNALVERETWLDNPAQVADNHQRIWTGLAQYGTPEASAGGPVTQGWLELARRVDRAANSSFLIIGQVREWQAAFPNHPANADVVPRLLAEHRSSGVFPPRVALLVPLSGRQAELGNSVRDGFFAAFYERSSNGQSPSVKVYDTAAMGAEPAFRRAIAEGAEVVVGPLLKNAVQDIAAVSDGTVTVLALNRLGTESPLPPGFFQFALSPEDEAEAAADRILADGHYRGIALVPASSWGDRLLAAFANRLRSQGGRLLEYRRYDDQAPDHGATLTTLLHLDTSQARMQRLSRVFGTRLEFEPRRRQDAEFIFIAARPQQGRVLRPELKFHYAGDLPVYATSDIFEPDARDNGDLDGVMFPEMPWLIAPDPSSAELKIAADALWPQRSPLQSRLFALGLDAYGLVALLYGGDPTTGTLAGRTGTLSVDAYGIVRRRLEWAQMIGGQPRVLPDPQSQAIPPIAAGED